MDSTKHADQTPTDKKPPNADDGGPNWNSNQISGESSPASPNCHEQDPSSKNEVEIRCWAKTPIKSAHDADDHEPPLFNHSPQLKTRNQAPRPSPSLIKQIQNGLMLIRPPPHPSNLGRIQIGNKSDWGNQSVEEKEAETGKLARVEDPNLFTRSPSLLASPLPLSWRIKSHQGEAQRNCAMTPRRNTTPPIVRPIWREKKKPTRGEREDEGRAIREGDSPSPQAKP